MTQPPFDPYEPPIRPVDYPPAHPWTGPQPPPPLQPLPYPGQMRAVDQHTSAQVRPSAVTGSFVLWVLTALSWPIGSLVSTLVEDGAIVGFGPVMALFTSVCVAIAGVWGAVLLFGGHYHARLGLVGGALVLGVLALAAVVVAAREGEAEAVSWLVAVLRLLLPAAATLLAFLPGTRQYFSGSVG
ncbi:MAG: hypothetical protein HOV94_23130 [Saccharothrix sp.]|nr:hypothetical protein [Saccharothrix sp.]